MKNRIIVAHENNEITFYIKNKAGLFRLTSRPFVESVFIWFENGRAEGEVLHFSKWQADKQLVNAITHIAKEIRSFVRYSAEDEYAA